MAKICLLLVILSVVITENCLAQTISKAAFGYYLNGATTLSTLTTATAAQCYSACVTYGAACKGANFNRTTSQCTLVDKDYGTASLKCDRTTIHYTKNPAAMPAYVAVSPELACLMNSGGNACPKAYQGCSVTCPSNVWTPSCTAPIYQSCSDAYNQGQRRNGIYLLQPDTQAAFEAYCQMDPDPVSNSPGGYVVAYRRKDGSLASLASKSWVQMIQGFGDMTEEFFIGLDKMNRLSSVTNELLILLHPFDGDYNAAYAKYSPFVVRPAGNNFALSIPTYTGGNAGESLQWQASFGQFATWDRDNTGPKCASLYTAPGWFYQCHGSNLFGRYLYGWNSASGQGAVWSSYQGNTYSYQRVEFRMR